MPAETKIRKDRLSGVAKTVEGIYPLLRAKEPTLDRLDHTVDFNNINLKQIRLELFYFIFYCISN